MYFTQKDEIVGRMHGLRKGSMGFNSKSLAFNWMFSGIVFSLRISFLRSANLQLLNNIITAKGRKRPLYPPNYDRVEGKVK